MVYQIALVIEHSADLMAAEMAEWKTAQKAVCSVVSTAAMCEKSLADLMALKIVLLMAEELAAC